MSRSRSISGQNSLPILFREQMSRSMTKEIKVALCRSEFYQHLSSGFLYPEQELFARVRDGTVARELRACARGVTPDGKAGLLAAIRNLESSFEGLTLESLQAEHRRIFGHTISKSSPPFETEFGGSNVFQQPQDLGDIAGFYRAFGLEVSDAIRERLDHISTELEFMQFLTYKEAYAREHHGKKKSEACLDAQRKFLKMHLGRWAPLFFERLARKAENGFYKDLARLSEKFLAFEFGFLKVEPERISQSQGSSFNPEEACALCEDMDSSGQSEY